MNIWTIIIAFLAGVGCGMLSARVFFPIVATKYNVVEKVVEKVVEVPAKQESYVPKKRAKKA